MRSLAVLIFLSFLNFTYSQNPIISELRWELDYNLYLQLDNDSSYTFDIRQLFHISNPLNNPKEYIYIPVNLNNVFLDSIKTLSQSNVENSKNYKTLWSALHQSIGGGWVHFINCILYAFETGNLSLTHPLMQRPQTSWKPKPITESYKRTKNWKYYVPVEYKNAKKEYKTRIKRNELGDLKNLPDEYIKLFISTNDKKYNLLKKQNKRKELAKIDLVKLLLGVNYLGDAQITYIRTSVLNAIKNYSRYRLPSIIIFDEFEAAAVMSLEHYGYKVEKIAFNKEVNLSYEEIKQRTEEILKIVDKINTYNRNTFEKQLKNYYKN